MPTVKLSTRLATPEDAAAIAAIYNEGIADRIATFETEPRSEEQITKQLLEKGDRFPTIVAEHDGRIVAWAGAGPYRARPAFAGVAEHSVYVARSAPGKGAGRVVLDALCRAYAERGFWKIVSRIFPENTASLTLHERCGFRVVGVYQRHGKLEPSSRRRHSPVGAMLPHCAEHTFLLRVGASRSQLAVMQSQIHRSAAPPFVVELWLSHCTA